MSRALYSDDRDRADRKRRELLKTRSTGGWYQEYGPIGSVIYSEWTCRWCTNTFRDPCVTRVAFHKLDYSSRPVTGQQALDAYDGGGDS